MWVRNCAYHMAPTAPCFHCKTIEHWCDKAAKRRTALLGTLTAPCDAILEDFVAFKHPSYLQPEKQMQTP